MHLSLLSVYCFLAADVSKRQRGELYKSIDADYYGYRDDDDGLLERLEKKQQDKLIAASLADWQANKKNRMDEAGASGDAAAASSSAADAQGAEEEAALSASAGGLKAHVELPSQEEIERIILEKKKKEIMDKYKNL